MDGYININSHLFKTFFFTINYFSDKNTNMSLVAKAPFGF